MEVKVIELKSHQKNLQVMKLIEKEMTKVLVQ